MKKRVSMDEAYFGLDKSELSNIGRQDDVDYEITFCSLFDARCKIHT